MNVDALAVMRTFLLSVAGVTAQVGATGVYAPYLPAGFTIAKAIEVSRNGGTASAEAPTISQNFQFKCYGSTAVEAQAVYGAMRDALHGTGPQQSGVIMSSWETSTAMDLRDGDVDFPYVLCFFTGMLRN